MTMRPIQMLMAGALALSTLSFQAAEATPCSFNTANIFGVQTNAGCELGSTNNDNLGAPPIQVNVDTMFGFNDWLFAEKAGGQQDIDIDFSVLGNGLAGTWSIGNIWGPVTDVMIVLKGPNGNSGVSPDTYVGYLLVSGDTSGTYLSPFFKTVNLRPIQQDISHWSAYIRGDVGVPEPATVALLGVALLGLSLRGRRPKLTF